MSQRLTAHQAAKSMQKPLLQINNFHLTSKQAEHAVTTLLRSYHREPIVGKWTDQNLISKKTGERSKTFSQMVDEMAKTGIVKDIQFDMDHKDNVFGWTLSLATTSGAIGIHVSHAGYESDIEGPGAITPTETSLMRDVLYFREQACSHSNEGSEFAKTTAYFRSYLFASLALVEAFLNRHTFIAEYAAKANQAQYEKLRGFRRFDDKIGLWLELFTSRTLDELKATKEWSHFQNIKRQRDNAIHSNHIYQAFSLKQIANGLNDVRMGIGGLMKLLRDYQDKASLEFIDRLHNAPEVRLTRTR